MICYVKLVPEKSLKNIIEKCQTLGIQPEVIIWDDSILQKQKDTIYNKLKLRLFQEKETLVIDTLTSIGKNNREIFKELSWLIENDIPFIILDIETTYKKEVLSTVNQTIWEIFKQLAQKEIRYNKACQKTGIAKARSEGKQLGRSKISYPDNWDSLYSQWKNKKISSKEFMKLSGLKKGTFYNLIKQYESDIFTSNKFLA